MEGEKCIPMDHLAESVEESMNPILSQSYTLDLGAFSGEPNDIDNLSSKDVFLNGLSQEEKSSLELPETCKHLFVNFIEAGDALAERPSDEYIQGPDLESGFQDQTLVQSFLFKGTEIPIEVSTVTVTTADTVSKDGNDAATTSVKIEPNSGSNICQIGNTALPSFYEMSPTVEGLREMLDDAMDGVSNVSDDGSYQSTKDVSEDVVAFSSLKKKMDPNISTEKVDNMLYGIGLEARGATITPENTIEKTMSQDCAGWEKILERPIRSPSNPINDLPQDVSAENKLTICVVANCRHYKNTKADHVFAFPDPVLQFSLRKLWLKKINEHCGNISMLSGIALLNATQAGVCNQHFVKEDFISGWLAYPEKDTKYQLNPQAVPSVFLNPTDYIQKPKQPATIKSVRQYATKTVHPVQKKATAGSQPCCDCKKKGCRDEDHAYLMPPPLATKFVNPGVKSDVKSTAWGKRNPGEMGSSDLSEYAEHLWKKVKPDDSDYTGSCSSGSHSSSDSDSFTKFTTIEKPVGTSVVESGKVLKSTCLSGKTIEFLKVKPTKATGIQNRHLSTVSTAARPSAALPINPKPAASVSLQVPRLVLQRSVQLQNQVVMVRATVPDGKAINQPQNLASPGLRPQLHQFVPRQQAVVRMIGPRATMPKPIKAAMLNQVGSVSRTLAAKIMIPSNATASTQKIQLAPVVSPTSVSAWKNSRTACRAVGVQIGPGDLQDCWEDEDIKDIMEEAHKEILELKYMLETAELELAVEKSKVSHLEGRVAAWIRLHFNHLGLETEWVEVLNRLANYYLDAGKKATQVPGKNSLELEAFRNTYSRCLKETEAYRQQIIELQNSSARQIDTLQQHKLKQERESQEVIAELRRQCADALASKTAAKYRLRAVRQEEQTTGSPPVVAKARGPRKPRGPSAVKPVASSALVVTTPLTTVAPVTRSATMSLITPIPPQKSSTLYVNPHFVNAPSTSGNVTAVPRAQVAAQPSPVSTSPSSRKRGNLATNSHKIDELPIPSPKKSCTRESSVERAVRYLRSL